MTYEWGSRHYKVDANVVGAELERISDANGAADAARILDAARPKHSPLHPVFTWDDSVAAESWRRQEARVMANSLVVVERNDDESEQRRPAFYHVSYTTDEGEEISGYQPVSRVVEVVDARESAAAELLQHLRGLQRRYAGLGDLFDVVWREVDAIEERVAA